MNNAREMRKALFRHRFRQYGTAYLFILPWVIGFGALIAFPVGWSLYMSLHKVVPAKGGLKYTYIGFQNYKDALLIDNIFPVELLEYVLQMLIIIPVIVIFSLLVSILLNQRFTGRFFFRAVFFLPVVFATGQVLTELFSQEAGKVPFLDQYNFDPMLQQYLGDTLAKPIIDFLDQTVIVLWYSGVQILIYIAGYQTISKSVYEAVRIDGATPWDSFWKITLPAMVPFISLNTVYTVIDLFTYPMNPVLAHVRSNMFKANTGYGYSSALAWIYFAIIFVILGLILWAFGRKGTRRR